MIKTYSQFNESVKSKYQQFKIELVEEIRKELRPALDIINDIVHILNDYEDRGHDFSIDECIIDAEKNDLIYLDLELENDDIYIRHENIDIIGIDPLIETFADIEEKKIFLNVGLNKWHHSLFTEFYNEMKKRLPFVLVTATDFGGNLNKIFIKNIQIDFRIDKKLVQNDY